MIDLKQKRKDAGLTQDQLAEKCRVVRQTICEIERGVNRPSVELAKSIAAALDFKWTEFFD